MKTLGTILFMLGLLAESRGCEIAGEECTCSYKSVYENHVNCKQEFDEFNSSESVVLYLSQLKNYTHIDISNKNWTRLDSTNFSFLMINRLLSLSLTSNNIQLIDDRFFSNGLNKLYSLNLEFNVIKACFNLNSSSLTQLTLVGNRIETIDDSCFKNAPNLQSIELSGNQIKQIDWNLATFVQLSELRFALNKVKWANISYSRRLSTLDLSFNYIERQDQFSLRELTMLSSLVLTKNMFKSVPDFSNLIELDYLYFDQQLITEITSDTLKHLPNLRYLYAARNLIKRIGNHGFIAISDVRMLDLSFNQIDYIEVNAFAGLSRLWNLKLRENRLQNITTSVFKSLSSLSYLDLSHNKLEALEANNFVGLESCSLSLVLSGNRFNYIKRDWFSNLYNLELIDLSQNSISSIERGSFDSSGSIETIDLSKNCLYQIDASLFNKQSKLTSLRLDNNLLGKFDVDAFVNQNHLKNLNLENNLIWDRLPTGLFRNLSKLVSLKLGNNHLTKLDEDLFNGLVSLKTLSVSINHLRTLNNSLDRLLSLTELDLSLNDMEIGERSIDIGPEIMTQIVSLNLSYNYVNLNQFLLEYSLNNLRNFYAKSIQLQASDEIITHFEGNQLVTVDMSDNNFLIDNRDIIEWINQDLIHLEALYLSKIGYKSSNLNFSLLTGLVLLDLSFNEVSEIYQFHFKNNLKLKTLKLSHNQIYFIEKKSLNHLSELTDLDLSFNKLTTLEGTGITISQFSKIITFRVNDNYLDYDRYELDHGQLIQTVDLSSNKIRLIRIDTGGVYDKLTLLNISFNLIERIQANTFRTCISLVELDLSYNLIQEISPSSFDNLISLGLLRLEHNQIVELHVDLFKGLTTLRELYLQHNRIELLKRGLFENQMELLTLSLNDNNLKLIEDLTFESMNQLVMLDISGNPDLQDFTQHTLDGLNQTRVATMKRLNSNNYLIVKQAFKPELRKKVIDIEYYRPVEVLYNDNEANNLTSLDCYYTLELIKLNIKLNLFTGYMFNNFVAKCQQIFNSLFHTH